MAAEIFLSQEDRNSLQEVYETWNDNANPSRLISLLFKNHIINSREKQEIEARPTQYAKNDYIFDNVLMRSPYDQLEVVYKLLLEVGDAAHRHLASLLPRRVRNQTRRHTEPFRDLSRGDEELSEPIQATASEHSFDNTQVPNSSLTDRSSIAENAGSSRRTVGDMTGNRTTPGQGQSDRSAPSSTISSRLSHYGVKGRNHKKLGKGVCVIIANFTGDLQGYERDVEAIADFFENQLNYEVFGATADEHNYRNLTRDQMLHTLRQIQEYLKSIAAARVDRFFLFVMSHGDKYGLKTCAEGSNTDQEGHARNEHLRVTPEEIISMFTHDAVPQMKDCPKCIFIQNCRGTEHVQAAARICDEDVDIPQLRQPLAVSDIAVGADVLVCHATKLGMLSWVNDMGSWFIQEVINTFKEHFQREHIIDLIGEVNNRISEKTGCSTVGGFQMQVRQLPDICYSLRKKFYLSIPDHLMQ